jgi:hypothetical protein
MARAEGGADKALFVEGPLADLSADAEHRDAARFEHSHGLLDDGVRRSEDDCGVDAASCREDLLEVLSGSVDDMLRTELLRELKVLARSIDGGDLRAGKQGELNDEVPDATDTENGDLRSG